MLGIGRARVKLLVVLTVTVGLVTLLSSMSYTSPSPRHQKSSSSAEMKREGTGDREDEGIEGRGVKEVNKIEVLDKGGVEGREKTPQKDLVKPKTLSPKELQKRADSLQDSPIRSFLREQTRRVAHVTESCRAFNRKSKTEELRNVNDIVVDRKDMLTFCPVYKAASTSWLITLLTLAGHWTPSTQTKSMWELIKKHFKKISGRAAISSTSGTTHFMVVRHPLERLLSCYRDKYENGRKDYYYNAYGEKMIRQQREALKHMSNKEVLDLQEEVRQALSSYKEENGGGAMEGYFLNLPHNPFANPVGPTFLEFSHYVVNTGHDDEHWRPYYAHCAPCILPYEFVLRFEHLHEETLLFLEYLNKPGDVALRGDNSNKAATAQVSCQYYSQLPLALIDRLVQKYEKDFIMYEYDAEDYRRCAKDYRSSSGSDGDSGDGKA